MADEQQTTISDRLAREMDMLQAASPEQKKKLIEIEKELRAEEERLEKLIRTQQALMQMEPTPAAERMRGQNTMEVLRQQGKTGALRKQLHQIMTSGNEALSINKTFEQVAEEMPGDMNPELKDRAKHAMWMQNLADDYGPYPAAIMGLFNEVGGLARLPRNVLKAPPGERLNRAATDLREGYRDAMTNKAVLEEYMSRGRMSPEEIEAVVRTLELEPAAEGEQQAAPITRENIFEALGHRTNGSK